MFFQTHIGTVNGSRQPSHLRTLCLTTLVGIAALNTLHCGAQDSGLGGAFTPSTTAPASTDRSPITAGSELWYTIGAFYRRDTVEPRAGSMGTEAQSGGSMCIKIQDVQDTALQAYANAAETVVIGKVRVAAPSGASSLDATDQNNPNATPAQVDALLQHLWLKRVTVPSQGHGFETAHAVTFHTRSAPQPAHGLAALPFFEVRDLSEQGWTGWDSNSDHPNAGNFLADLRAPFFAAPFGGDFVIDPNRMQQRIITPLANCESHSDAMACVMASGCTWAPPPGGNQSACLGLFTARLVWRETLQDPVEIKGPVVHQIELTYTKEGILSSGTEMIVPDVWTGQPVPTGITDCGTKCLSAVIINSGTWNDSGLSAPCKF